VREVRNSLVGGHAATNSEDKNGDDERPEVEFTPMTEGVIGVGRLATFVHAKKHQSPLPVSTSEWIASESMAELPVKAAAKNLITAIARLPTIAATIAVVDFEVDDSFSISFTPPLMMKFGEFDQMNVTSSPENVLAPIGTGDDKVHQNQHQIVMPSGRVLSQNQYAKQRPSSGLLPA